MKFSFHFFLLIVCCLFGWLLSGSWLPVAAALISLVAVQALHSCNFPLNRITIVPMALLAVTLQIYLHQSGVSPMLYEYLTGIYFVAQGLFLYLAMTDRLERDRGGSAFQEAGGLSFCLALAGSILLLASAASASFFRFDTLAVSSLAALPLAATLWKEYHRSGPHSKLGLLVFLALAVPLLGQMSILSRKTSRQLRSWIGGEEALGYEYEFPDATGEETATGVGIDGAGGVIRLPKQANIRLDPETRCFLKFRSLSDFVAATRRPIYLRTATVSIFRGNDEIAPLKVERWILDGEDGDTDGFVTLSPKESELEFDYSIVLPKKESDRVPLLVNTHRLRQPEIYQVSGGRYQLAHPRDDLDWFHFTAAASRSSKSRPAALATPSGSDATYMSLPDTKLVRQVQMLSERIVSRSQHTDSRIGSISNYIKGHCEYSLNYHNPRGLAPVENLLFGERKGHCELFAASTVMLLRSAGIPCRMAYGFAGGASNRKELAVALRGSDVHAWVEVPDEGGSWRIVDTTPAGRGAPRMAQAGRHSRIDWKVASFDFFTGADEAANGGEGSAFFSWLRNWPFLGAPVYQICFSVIVIGLIFFGANWVRRRWSKDNFDSSAWVAQDQGDSSDLVTARRPAFVRAILTLGESAGVAKSPGLPLRPYVSALRSKGIGDESLSEAADYFYAIRYEGSPPDAALERRLTRQIRDWTGSEEA